MPEPTAAKPLRTFIALDLDGPARAALRQLRNRLRPAAPRDAAWVADANLHVTVKFLGDVPADKMPALLAALAAAVAGLPRFTLRLRGTGLFTPRQPRVLWVGAAAPDAALQTLFSQVEAALQPLGFPSEDRGFRPHITIARLRQRVDGRFLDLIRAGAEEDFAAVPAVGLTVYHSELTRSGAVYSSAGRAPFAK